MFGDKYLHKDGRMPTAQASQLLEEHYAMPQNHIVIHKYDMNDRAHP